MTQHERNKRARTPARIRNAIRRAIDERVSIHDVMYELGIDVDTVNMRTYGRVANEIKQVWRKIAFFE
jgi:hypothetical protein